MVDPLAAVRTALETIVSALEPDRLEPGEAARMWQQFTKIERLAHAGRLLLAGRAEMASSWAKSGHRTPVQAMAEAAGESVGATEAELTTSAQLAGLPATTLALRAGELSGVQAKTVADAAHADPDAEQKLLESARQDSLSGLRKKAQRVKAEASGEDEKKRYQRIHENRDMKSWTDDDGAVRVLFRFTPDAGAAFLAAIAEFRKLIFDQARLAGRRDPYGAYSADAAVAMAKTAVAALHGEPASGPPKARPAAQPTMHVRLDLSALRRGFTVPGEVCEVGGVPFPVEVAKGLLDDAAVWFLLTDGTDVRKIVRWDRHIPPALRQALMERDRVCDVMGCDRTDGLEIDHCHIDFADGGPTCYDNLRRLCHWHHHLKTYKGYRIEGPPGQAVLIPPDDE